MQINMNILIRFFNQTRRYILAGVLCLSADGFATTPASICAEEYSTQANIPQSLGPVRSGKGYFGGRQAIFSKDEGLMIFMPETGRLDIYDTSNWKIKSSLFSDSDIASFSAGNAKNFFAVGYSSGKTEVYDLSTLKVVYSKNVSKVSNTSLKHVMISASGQYLAIFAQSSDQEVDLAIDLQVVDLFASGKIILETTVMPMRSQFWDQANFYFTADEKQIVIPAASWSRPDVFVLDLATGKSRTVTFPTSAPSAHNEVVKLVPASSQPHFWVFISQSYHDSATDRDYYLGYLATLDPQLGVYKNITLLQEQHIWGLAESPVPTTPGLMGVALQPKLGGAYGQYNYSLIEFDSQLNPLPNHWALPDNAFNSYSTFPAVEDVHFFPDGKRVLFGNGTLLNWQTGAILGSINGISNMGLIGLSPSKKFAVLAPFWGTTSQGPAIVQKIGCP